MSDFIPNEIVLSVGKRYPEWQGAQDGFRIEWSETGLILCAILNGISEDEREQFSPQTSLTVRYTVIGDVCYFTFLFGAMPWADCPFSPALYHAVGQNPTFPVIEDGQGLSLTVLLIDASTGELCGVRLIGLGHDFSLKWKEWAQEAAKKPLDFAEYNRQIDRVYREYASVDLALMGGDNMNEYVVQP